jgi:hypothetical protein
MVIKSDNLGGLPAFFQRGVTNDAHSLLITPVNTWHARRGSGNAGSFSVSPSIDQSLFYLVTMVFRTDLSRLYIGNTQGTDNTATVTAPSGNKVLTLFALSSAYQSGLPGIAEFIYYHSELTLIDQTKARTYLSKKWGLTL